MTPAETLARIEGLTKRDLRLAWTTALLHRTSKFPDKPEDMWSRPGQAGGDLVTLAKAMKAGRESEERLAEIRKRYRARRRRREERKRRRSRRAKRDSAPGGAPSRLK